MRNIKPCIVELGKREFGLDCNLLSQLSQTHGLGQLLHRNSIVQERFGIVKVGVICPVAGDEVEGIHIYAEMIDEISLRPSGHRRFDGEEAVDIESLNIT